MEYEEMRGLEITHCCARCGAVLVTVWDDVHAVHRLACGTDKTHQGIKKLTTATEMLARGELDEAARQGTQKDMAELAHRQPDRFNMLPRADVETGVILSPDDVKALDMFAQNVSLDIYLGHVGLYRGEPRVTIDGYYYLAKCQGRKISVCALPAAAEERGKYAVMEGDHLYIARGWEGDKALQEVGIGIVTKSEIEEMSKKKPGQLRSPIAARYPQRMAEKRAEWQLLRKVIPLEVTA